MTISAKYTRQPKHYIKLPSECKYYPAGSIKLSHSDELPVRAMTARDELILKNPEALLNGDSIAKVIQSCCPEIGTDIMGLLSTDIEVILLAIMSASFNETLDFESTCPECGTTGEFETYIPHLLDSAKPIMAGPYVVEKTFTIDDQNHTVKIHLKPYTYKQLTRRSLVELEHSKMYNFLIDKDLDDDSKLAQYSKSFEKMVEENFFSIVDCVIKIETPDGDITDPNEIQSFVYELSKDTIDLIVDLLNEISASGIDREFTATCVNKQCGHTWKTSVELDPAHFFGSAYGR